MIKKNIIFSVIFYLQWGLIHSQVDNNEKIYAGIIELKNESPFYEDPRFRKLIFTFMGDQSTLELVDYITDFNGEIKIITTENNKVDKIEGGLYIFKPSNINFQLMVKVKKKCSILTIKRIKKGPITKRKKKKVRLMLQ